MVLSTKEESCQFFNNVAALNHIYRSFPIIQLQTAVSGIRMREIAFPGTFDPFTLSHKGIVQEIKLGFEVYLSSTSFPGQRPCKCMRRKIITISTGNERTYVLPDEIQINLATRKIWRC